MSGMTAQVFFVVNAARDVLHVPVAAVQKAGRDQWQVKVANGNKAPRAVSVQAGISNRVRRVILQGLSEGDEVVLGRATSDTPQETGGRRRGGLF